MAPGSRSVFLKDSIAATVAVVALYVLAQHVLFQPLQVPGYLLVVGFDALEATFGSAGRAYPVLFGAYLVTVGVLGGAVAHVARQAAVTADAPAWRLGLAGGFAVVGVLAFVFAALVFVGTDQRQPVYLAGGVGVALFAVAAALSDAFGVVERVDGR